MSVKIVLRPGDAGWLIRLSEWYGGDQSWDWGGTCYAAGEFGRDEMSEGDLRYTVLVTVEAGTVVVVVFTDVLVVFVTGVGRLRHWHPLEMALLAMPLR